MDALVNNWVHLDKNNEPTLKIINKLAKEEFAHYKSIFNDTIGSWLGKKTWEKLFFRVLRDKGIKTAYVSLKKNDKKFYVFVDNFSVKKVIELSTLYNNFLNSGVSFDGEPYFDFLVFDAKTEKSQTFGSEFIVMKR